MKLSDLWSRREEAPESKQMSLSELSDKYDVLHVNEIPGAQYAIVAERGQQFKDAAAPLSRELGTSSPSPFTSFTRQEYNPLLQGLSGLEMYDRMRRSDGTVRGTLRSIKIPALSGRWFVEAAEVTDQQKEMATFIWRNLTEMMSISWPQVLTEALLMADFGYYMFEKVWENQEIDGKMRTVLVKLAPRHPMDVAEWDYDSNGGPNGVWMHCAVTDEHPNGKLYIEIDKLLVFSFDREAGNIEGISVLRSAYKHWYFKEQLYKIDAIQKERHGIGIPVVKLPMGYKDADKLAADELGRNIRTNERAHITLPPGWEIFMLKLEGNPVDALKSVEHHNSAIRENILVNFVVEGAREEDLVVFLKASRFVADIVSETFNQYLIPQMVKFNWSNVDRIPKLRVRRIGESADWRTLSFALRNLIGAGVIIPDEALEANMREEMDLPALDKSTARLIATPQNPYDINEDIDEEDGSQDQVDQRVGENQADDEGDKTHNKNNPNYNRGRKKRTKGVKQSGMKAGLPRQTPVGQQRGPKKTGGSDRSGG